MFEKVVKFLTEAGLNPFHSCTRYLVQDGFRYCHDCGEAAPILIHLKPVSWGWTTSGVTKPLPDNLANDPCCDNPEDLLENDPCCVNPEDQETPMVAMPPLPDSCGLSKMRGPLGQAVAAMGPRRILTRQCHMLAATSKQASSHMYCNGWVGSICHFG